MKHTGFIWGLGGVLALLGFAVYRLSLVVLELEWASLSWLEQTALAISIGYMVYAEGYKGFHLAFAPRVVLRAAYLWQHPRPWHVLLAPAFCMGFIHATKKRQLLSISLTLMIIGFVLLVRLLPQPWRGIVDAGVVAGLVFGIGSILYFVASWWQDPTQLPGTAEVPDNADAEAE